MTPPAQPGGDSRGPRPAVVANRALARILRPVLRSTFALTLLRLERVPKPLDEPMGWSEGPQPARILLIGDGPALGYGVATHQLALPGQLARRVGELTGRGVSVVQVGDDEMTVAGMTDRLAEEDPRQYDVLLVLVGAVDAATLTPVPVWARHLRGFLDVAAASGWHRILVVGIPPVDRLPVLRGLRARLASQHIERLNVMTAAIARPRQGVAFLPFCPGAASDRGRYRSASTYADWAARIGPEVAGALAVQRPES